MPTEEETMRKRLDALASWDGKIRFQPGKFKILPGKGYIGPLEPYRLTAYDHILLGR